MLQDLYANVLSYDGASRSSAEQRLLLDRQLDTGYFLRGFWSTLRLSNEEQLSVLNAIADGKVFMKDLNKESIKAKVSHIVNLHVRSYVMFFCFLSLVSFVFICLV